MSVKNLSFTKDISAVNPLHYVASEANDELLLAAGTLVKNNRYTQDVAFQASVGVDLYFTLSLTSDSTNPDSLVQAAVLWEGPVTLAPGVITHPRRTFTAIKAIWSAPGALNIALQ